MVNKIVVVVDKIVHIPWIFARGTLYKYGNVW